MTDLLGALFFLFPANLLFLIAAWRATSGFEETKASSGIYLFVIFNTIYLTIAIELCFVKLQYPTENKILFIAFTIVLLSIFLKKRISKWLVKTFGLVD